MRICFVALEILGPFTGGGIATALAGQAEHHAREHDVTVLYVHPNLSAEDAPEWEEYYAARNIRFVRAEFDTFYPRDNIQKRSFAVKEYLQSWGEEFDVIYFHDYLGLGYYTALTRQLGLGFANTRLGTVIHGPSEWARSLNMVSAAAEDITLYEMERKQAEYSDFTVAPSQHILDWCTEQGWRLPDDTRPISNILPHRIDLHTGLRQGDLVTGIEEVAYFGRLEIRKGFFTFLDTIKYMHKNGLKLPRKITFLGAFCTNSDRNAASTVLEYAQSWDCEIQFLNNYDHEAAIRYLVTNRPLTIVPSMDESFGLTAYECLSFGVPTLFSNRGALVTLPAAPEREAVLFEPRANVLAKRISEALETGVVIGAVAGEHLRAGESWDKLLADLSGPVPPVDSWGKTVSIDDLTRQSVGEAPAVFMPPEGLGTAEPLVSVILVHHNRPSTLAEALKSVLAQTYTNIEIIIVDDGSTAQAFRTVESMVAEAGDDRVHLYRQENRYLGAARNFGVSHARGDYLMFMDDDNFALPNEVETFVRVAVSTGADVLNTVSRLFRSAGDDRLAYDLYLPVGPSLPLALFGNTFGDANALVRRTLFEKLGGFTEEYAQGCEDYEFFNRAFMSGARMQLVPELIFDYRADDDSMMKELNSGKYIINQLRGVSPLFDSHRLLDLAQMRGIMRVGFFTAIEREYTYWTEQSIERRRHAELEAQLANLRYRPNSPEACELVVKLLAAYGRVREALAFMERNDITPDDTILRQMHTLLARYERRGQNTGRQRNGVTNGAFEFWSLGTRHEGVDPYQFVANDWLIPSSKRRGALVVSQEQDNALFPMTRTRTAKYMRINNARPDPEGYCFLTQRIMDVGRLMENEVDLSLLARTSYPGPLNAFLRVTYEHGTEEFEDIWPTRQAWLTEDWQLLDLRFDLSSYRLESTRETSFVSVFFKVPTAEVATLDLTDVVALPHGNGTAMEPYIRENERQRAERRMFPAGRDARFMPMGDRNLRVDLPAFQAGKLSDLTQIHVRSTAVLALADGNFLELSIESAERRPDPEDPTSQGYIHVVVDKEVGQIGTAMEDFMIVTNYLWG